jgi:hypothetical protein
VWDACRLLTMGLNRVDATQGERVIHRLQRSWNEQSTRRTAEP